MRLFCRRRFAAQNAARKFFSIGKARACDSCTGSNQQGLQVTAEDLRGKYRLNLEALIVFYNAYMDFIGEVTHAKN